MNGLAKIELGEIDCTKLTVKSKKENKFLNQKNIKKSSEDFYPKGRITYTYVPTYMCTHIQAYKHTYICIYIHS